MQKPDCQPLMPWEIIVDGTPHNINYRITVDGNQIDLPFRLFRIFAILAVRRDIDSGWVDGDIVSWSGTLATRYVSKTRRTLQAANWGQPGGVDGAWLVIESNPAVPSQYRLIAKSETIRINPELVRFDDRVVAEEARLFVIRASDRLICPEGFAPALMECDEPRQVVQAVFDESDGLGPVILIEITPENEDESGRP